MAFFSVVIPLYNKAYFISDCLESALKQTFEDYEIIIVNDGSTDNSVAVVEGFSSEKITLIHQENQGASKARNNGVAIAKSEFIAFLDADDIWKPNHLEVLKESIDAFPNAGLYANNYAIKHSKTFIKPAKLNIEISNNKPLILDNFFKASLEDVAVWTSCAALKKKLFENFKGFDPIYLSSQDLDLWIRIALQHQVVFNPKSTMIYNKSIIGSLGKYEDNDARYTLYSAFQNEEKKDPYLSMFLNQKRYGLALRTKINGEVAIYRKTMKLINKVHLSRKQKLLLNTPAFILQSLNKIRPYILKNKLYLQLFKN